MYDFIDIYKTKLCSIVHNNLIQLIAESDLRYWGRTVSRRGLTVRKSLDMLSRQLDAIQKERNELKNALTSKEKEISDLIK